MKKRKTVFAVIISFIFILAATAAAVFLIGKSNTKESIIKDWSRTEISELKITTVDYTLKVTEDKIIYGKKTLLSEDTINTYSYEVTVPGKMTVEGREYEVHINKDKTMLTISPGLTSGKDSENWYYIQ